MPALREMKKGWMNGSKADENSFTCNFSGLRWQEGHFGILPKTLNLHRKIEHMSINFGDLLTVSFTLFCCD